MIVVDRLDPSWGEAALALWLLKKVDPARYSAEALTAYLESQKLADVSALFGRTLVLPTYERCPTPARNEEFLYVHGVSVYLVVVR